VDLAYQLAFMDRAAEAVDIASALRFGEFDNEVRRAIELFSKWRLDERRRINQIAVGSLA